MATSKADSANYDEIMAVAKVLWGIQFFRNNKVWENKLVSAAVAMDWSTKFMDHQKQAKASRAKCTAACAKPCQPFPHRWTPPKSCMYNLNTDVAYKVGSNSFSVGLILRDHLGSFVAGKVA